MTRWMRTVGLLATVAVVWGCAGEGVKAPTPKAMVAGTVQLDGKPMDEKEGEITFTVSGEAPISLPIKAGKFEGEVPVGESKVEIFAYKMGVPIMMAGKPFGDPVKENYIPPAYNIQSTVKTKVEAAGAKDLKFEAASK